MARIRSRKLACRAPAGQIDVDEFVHRHVGPAAEVSVQLGPVFAAVEVLEDEVVAFLGRVVDARLLIPVGEPRVGQACGVHDCRPHLIATGVGGIEVERAGGAWLVNAAGIDLGLLDARPQRRIRVGEVREVVEERQRGGLGLGIDAQVVAGRDEVGIADPRRDVAAGAVGRDADDQVVADQRRAGVAAAEIHVEGIGIGEHRADRPGGELLRQ